MRITRYALLLAPILAVLPGLGWCADNIREVLCTREYASNMQT